MLGLLQEGQEVSMVEGERGLGRRGSTPDISQSQITGQLRERLSTGENRADTETVRHAELSQINCQLASAALPLIMF